MGGFCLVARFKSLMDPFLRFLWLKKLRNQVGSRTHCKEETPGL